MTSDSTRKHASSPIQRVIHALGSIRTGMIILAAILIYASIGSGIAPVRGALEMTDGQVFEHWVFVALVAMLCVSLVGATLTRIRWGWRDAGAVMAHAGLLTLIGGSWWYFANKVEGDVLLVTPRIEILADAGGLQPLGRFPAEAGESWEGSVPTSGVPVRVVVESVEDYPDGPNPRAAVHASFTNTEQRAVLKPNDGPRPIGNGLFVQWRTFPAQSKFYDDQPALYCARKGQPRDQFVPLAGLPLHRERYLESGGTLTDTLGRPVPTRRTWPHLHLFGLDIPTGWLEPWRLPIDVEFADMPFVMRVTGYVPYVAELRSRIDGGNPRLNPVAEIRVQTARDNFVETLAALDPRRSLLELAVPIEFRWVNSQEELERLLLPLEGPYELEVEILNPPSRQTIAIQPDRTYAVAGTDYQLRVAALLDSWRLASPGYEDAASAAAIIEVRTPGRSFRRMVIERFPQLNQDIDEHGRRHAAETFDPNLRLALRSSPNGRVLLICGPDLPATLGVFQPDGSTERLSLSVGTSREFHVSGFDIRLSLLDLQTHGRLVEEPVIEPLDRRRPNMGRSASAIQLRLQGRGRYKGWSESRWCLFSEYPQLDASTAPAGLAARPVTVRLPDGTEYEIVYSRVQRDLGAALVPGRLRVKFFPGRRGAQSWQSDFYVRSAESPHCWPAVVKTNQTMRLGRWTLFQSGASQDHWSWTILGVGNRRGIWPMTIGSILVTAGCLYAFYVKPVLKRRGLRKEAAKQPHQSGAVPARTNGAAVALLALLLVSPAAATEPFAASRQAAALDRQIDWRRAALIVVQDAGRYKTLDSFARESMAALHGREHLPGLSPLASLCEWLFNREAYTDIPLIRIRDRGLRIHLSDRLPEAARQRIVRTGYMTPRELAEPSVQQRLAELEPRFEMGRSIERVRRAEAVARFIDELVRIVPRPGAAADAPWYTPLELRTNAALALPADQRPTTQALLRQFGPPAADVTPEQAVPIVAAWLELEQAWKKGDAPTVQKRLDQLAAVLPELAAAGVYPSEGQRRAEARYYANFIGSGIFSRASLGWLLYLFGGLVSVLALVTGWRKPWVAGLALLAAALAWHAYGLSLRWYVVGRIPVANMFEAITASAWLGIALALLVEVLYRTRFFLLAAHGTGFFALIVASYVLPRMGSSGGEITPIMGILDDIMLRIHTVLIIAAYALIFLAALIAAVYLFGHYFHSNRQLSLRMGLIAAALGLLTWTASRALSDSPSAMIMTRAELIRWAAAGAAGVCVLALIVLTLRRSAPPVIAAANLLLVSLVALLTGVAPVAKTVGVTMLAGGAAWSLLHLAGWLLSRKKQGPASVENRPAQLPAWLEQADWSHLIILNLAFVLLFAGIVLGAVWADYSWGRPWGWDPKETFALNTWIIYAILIHIRHVVRQRGLWTAWLSIAGCAMMAFNWFVVNFYIVGLHSYA